jgi:hypothetical protein
METTAVKKPYHMVDLEAAAAVARVERRVRSSGDIRWHGSQNGRVSLADHFSLETSAGRPSGS